MDDSPLLVDVSGPVSIVTFNRPKALNALNGRLRTELVAALRALDDRDDVRAIVLTGAGRAFCAGLDVKELAQSGQTVADNVDAADIGATIAALRTPIIAAVNGLAVTGGFEITLACDLVVACEDAWFQDTHASIGLLPGWGLSQRLSRVAGPYRAKDISLTARKVSAAEAAVLGFVNRVVPSSELLSEARSLAQAIAQWPAAHIARLKALIDDGYGRPFHDALALEAERARDLNLQVTIPRSR